MAASASASEVGPMMAKVALECGGDISASQEDILANSPFLGAAGNAPAASASASQAREDEEEEEEVFATPPEHTQQDPITMCSLPFTPTPSQPQSPSPPTSDDDAAAAKPRRKPRVCTRKVRGAKISTPTPTPTPSPKQHQQPEQPPHAAVDPLYRAVLMIPTATAAAAATTSKQDPLVDFLALARQRGLL